MLIPEVDFIISCMAMLDFLRKESSEELSLLFLEGKGEPFLRGRVMRFKRSTGVWTESLKEPQAG